MADNYDQLSGGRREFGSSGPAAEAPPIDLVTFRRLLCLRDVARVHEWLGWRAACRRWLLQVWLFAGLHFGWAKTGLALARERMSENSAPLDRQLRDVAEFAWLWTLIALMATAHFCGAPFQGPLYSAYSRMRSALAVPPVAISALPPHVA